MSALDNTNQLYVNYKKAKDYLQSEGITTVVLNYILDKMSTIANGETTIYESAQSISEELDYSQIIVSHGLEELEEAGIITMDKDNNTITINKDFVQVL